MKKQTKKDLTTTTLFIFGIPGKNWLMGIVLILFGFALTRTVMWPAGILIILLGILYIIKDVKEVHDAIQRLLPK